MNNRACLFIVLLLMSELVFSMKIDEDPRSILSFMDKSLSPELDILRVTTKLSPDNQLVFRLRVRGEQHMNENKNFFLLHILHKKSYVLLFPLNKEKANKVMLYESEIRVGSHITESMILRKSVTDTDFSAEHVYRGIEFNVPLDWINFGEIFGFDAYTVEADIQGDNLQILKIHDHARKGRSGKGEISAITLLNKICSPQK